MSEPRTLELTDEQIAFLQASLDYSAMHSRDYDYGPELVDFGKQQRASEQAMIDSIRAVLAVVGERVVRRRPSWGSRLSM